MAKQNKFDTADIYLTVKIRHRTCFNKMISSKEIMESFKEGTYESLIYDVMDEEQLKIISIDEIEPMGDINDE